MSSVYTTYRDSGAEAHAAAVRAINALYDIPPKVCVRTFGCQQNEADSERIAGMALDMGYVYTDEPEEASLIIYNTCAVREHAELRALSLAGQLKHLKAARPSLIIGICGCMVAQDHRLNDIKHKYPYVDFLFGATSHERFPEYLHTVLTEKKRKFFPDTSSVIAEELPVRRDNDRRAWVSIMYGCNNFCTYCVVPYVRGRERSRRAEQVLSEVSELVSQGVREITLLGQNVNSYGSDSADGVGFPELLERICRIDGDFTVQFMTSHPKDVTDRLIDVIAENKKISRHFHLPVQSGSDRVLGLMNRRYTRGHYLSLVSALREKIPDISITTDIIVGFPSESEEDFGQTLALLDEVRFDAIFSFIYSPRLGTPAAVMPDQIPEEVKKERFARLIELQNRISLENNSQYVGKTLEILVDGISKNDPCKLSGRTDKSRPVHFSGDISLTGSTVSVKITSADTFSLNGELI